MHRRWKNQTKENEYTWESARDRWSIETRHIGKLKSIRASKNGNKKLIKWTMTRETYRRSIKWNKTECRPFHVKTYFIIQRTTEY